MLKTTGISVKYPGIEPGYCWTSLILHRNIRREIPGTKLHKRKKIKETEQKLPRTEHLDLERTALQLKCHVPRH